MAEPNNNEGGGGGMEPVVLPFKAEKITFGFDFGGNDTNFELAAICLDRNGQLVDAAHADRPAALGGALRLAVGAGARARGVGAAAVMLPFDFAPQVEAMLFVLSAPASPLRRSDLGCAARLRFSVAAREKGSASEDELVSVDLAPHVRTPAAAAHALSNGHQSMLAAAAYATPGGWAVAVDGATFGGAGQWGALLPALGARAAELWPFLSAAEAIAARGPRGALAAIPSARPGFDAPLTALVQESLARQRVCCEDEPAPAAACDEAAAASSSPSLPPPLLPARLVLEVGWTLHPPRRRAAGEDDAADGGGEAYEEEEDEPPPELEFALVAYDLAGRELAAVSAAAPEADGMAVADPSSDEDGGGEAAGDGDEQQQQQQQEEEAGAGSEAEETDAAAAAPAAEEDGEQLEGGGEAGDEAAADGSAAEATAGTAKDVDPVPPPAWKPFYPEKFPRKHKVTVVLAELPRATRTLLLTVSNYAGGGLKRVESLQARVAMPPGKHGGSSKGGSSKSTTTTTTITSNPCVLLHCRLNSAEGADEAVTQVALLKLYRELDGTAFATWAAAGAESAEALAAACAVGGSGSSGGDVLAAKDLLTAVVQARQKHLADAAAAKAKAEDAGEDDPDADADDADEEAVLAEAEAAPGGVCARSGRVQRLRLLRGQWRARVVATTAPGDAPDEMLTANALGYEGALSASDGARHDAAAKATLANGDSYFGGYRADAKHGAGLYVFAGGAAYLGGFAAGKREGRGAVALPDGGFYAGAWVADRFEGEGKYWYPDGSTYEGGWKAGRKHGYGALWDAGGGCLRGQWADGALSGDGAYDRPNYHFEGRFAAGLPAGPCAFAAPLAYRTAGLPLAATSHATAASGATLRVEGAYALPPGSVLDAAVGGGAAADDDAGADGRPPLPCHPKYEGLSFAAGGRLPVGVADIPFPPPPPLAGAV